TVPRRFLAYCRSSACWRRSKYLAASPWPTTFSSAPAQHVRDPPRGLPWLLSSSPSEHGAGVTARSSADHPTSTTQHTRGFHRRRAGPRSCALAPHRGKSRADHLALTFHRFVVSRDRPRICETIHLNRHRSPENMHVAIRVLG